MRLFGIIVFICLSIMAAGYTKQVAPEITVSNHVEFVTERTNGRTQYLVVFKLTVVNNGDAPVPDLRIEHIRKYARFLLNGRPTSTSADFGGLEVCRKTNTLSRGESHSYGWGLLLDENGSKPEVSTVQWEYLGVQSRILEVDRKNRTVREINGQPSDDVPPSIPSKEIHATSAQDIVDDFILTVGAMEDKFPELRGFTQAAKERINQADVVFRRGVMRGKGKESWVGENGIVLCFGVFQDNVPTQLNITDDSYSYPLKNLHSIGYGIIRLPDTPSEGLHDALGKIMREHINMLKQIDKLAANKPAAPSGSPTPQARTDAGKRR